MNVFTPDPQAIREAHARLSLQLPARFFAPLKIDAPIEPDEPAPAASRDPYIPAWARGVFDV